MRKCLITIIGWKPQLSDTENQLEIVKLRELVRDVRECFQTMTDIGSDTDLH